MKKVLSIAITFLYIFSVTPQCAAYYLDDATPGQKVGAFGLALGSMAALITVAGNKPFKGIGLGCLAFSTIFMAPLVDDFLDTSRKEPKRVHYDRVWLRCYCALASVGLGILGCKILKESQI